MQAIGHKNPMFFISGSRSVVMRQLIKQLILSVFFIPLLIIGMGVSGQVKHIQHTIEVPEGYTRVNYLEDTFSSWIQRLPLKEENTILSHTGKEVANGNYHIFAVVDIGLLFKRDLEQCADFCMRFWAEYHKAKEDRLTALYLFDYGGNKKLFRESGKSYRNFLKWAFGFSNSYSLKRGGLLIDRSDIRPGDMIVQNDTGGIGHVSMVLDKCVSNDGDCLYLIGFSFMPAQEFHIEKATADFGVQGWFSLDGYYRYLSQYYNFGTPVLRRFSPSGT
jgi:hypothetical protein